MKEKNKKKTEKKNKKKLKKNFFLEFFFSKSKKFKTKKLKKINLWEQIRKKNSQKKHWENFFSKKIEKKKAEKKKLRKQFGFLRLIKHSKQKHFPCKKIYYFSFLKIYKEFSVWKPFLQLISHMPIWCSKTSHPWTNRILRRVRLLCRSDNKVWKILTLVHRFPRLLYHYLQPKIQHTLGKT